MPKLKTGNVVALKTTKDSLEVGQSGTACCECEYGAVWTVCNPFSASVTQFRFFGHNSIQLYVTCYKNVDLINQLYSCESVCDGLS